MFERLQMAQVTRLESSSLENLDFEKVLVGKGVTYLEVSVHAKIFGHQTIMCSVAKKTGQKKCYFENLNARPFLIFNAGKSKVTLKTVVPSILVF